MKIFKKVALGVASTVTALTSIFGATGCSGDENKFKDTSSTDIQYCVLMVTNVYYERLESYVRQMIELYGENDPSSKRMYAFGVVGPMAITQSIEQMQDEVNYVFALAEKYDVPVFFQMDDCTNYSTEFGDEATIDDEGNKYYDDPEMCEWVAFPEEGEEWGGQSYGALPRAFCGWSGNPYATAGGFPCFNSEKYLTWFNNQVQKGFIEPLIENYSRLSNKNKSYLLAGINTGWETNIPDYSNATALQYKDYERAQYGMHALYNLGYDLKSLKKEAAQRHITVDALKKELLYGVIADYIEFTCKMFYDAGIGRHKIFSHIVSISSATGVFTTEHMPTWVCINDYCTPGWTMSPKTCPYDLSKIERELAERGRNEYVNAEGYAHYDDEDGCRAYFEESLGRNARLITAFGYDNPNGQYGFRRDKDFYYVKVLNEWLSYRLLPNYDWNIRPDLG